MIVDLTRERAKRRIEQPPSYTEKTGRMSDAEFEQQCSRVDTMIRTLVPIIGIDEYNVRLVLDPGPIGECGEAAVMSVANDWRYLWATITASVPLCADESDEDLMTDVFHEGAHVIISPLRPAQETDDWRDREELAATKFSRMGINSYKAGCERGREEAAEDLAAKDREILALKREVKKLKRVKAA